ncbi:MAG TPA: terminase family protein [Bryobacteraceae bacterium]|nr:terminase family protein [Bryobacteraceae bacterium]
MASLPGSERAQLLSGLSEAEANSILWNWKWNARPKQLRPGSEGAASTRTDWRFWLALAGRGWGKTRVGAETCREWAEDPTERILMIAPTASDVRDVMIEGPSGLMSCYPPTNRAVYFPTRHLVQFPSGAIGITVSADEPDRIRGKQFRKFWFDELAAAQYAQEAWDQVMFGFRLPDAALQGLITTTPKPIKVLKAIIANEKTVITRGSSDENIGNLSPEFISDVIDPYRGTRLGRQEIEAELLEDVPGALWTRSLIDATRGKDADVRADGIVRIVVAIDPAVTHNEDSDETGIIVAALTIGWHVLILDDLSCRESPLGWAQAAVAAYRCRRADCIVAEVNNGGDLVAANIRALDPSANVRSVRASRGKYIRAEPVANLYTQGRVHHIGMFGALEDQLCSWSPQGNERSPDRMDALVWAVTELLIDVDQTPIGISPVGDYTISKY